MTKSSSSLSRGSASISSQSSLPGSRTINNRRSCWPAGTGWITNIRRCG